MSTEEPSTAARKISPPAIVVADDGVGVDPADVPTLFLPFRSENPQGHGLGLPLAKKILLLQSKQSL